MGLLEGLRLALGEREGVEECEAQAEALVDWVDERDGGGRVPRAEEEALDEGEGEDEGDREAMGLGVAASEHTMPCTLLRPCVGHTRKQAQGVGMEVPGSGQMLPAGQSVQLEAAGAEV